MNHLYLTFIAICFLYRCVYVSVIQFSQWNSLWLFEFTGASVLSILYTTYNVPIIKGIHHRFHGILGVVMVSGEKEVSTLPCQATCWILFSFDLFFSLDYFTFLLHSLLFHSNNTKYSSRTYCARYRAKHFKFIVSFNPKKAPMKYYFFIPVVNLDFAFSFVPNSTPIFLWVTPPAPFPTVLEELSVKVPSPPLYPGVATWLKPALNVTSMENG